MSRLQGVAFTLVAACLGIAAIDCATSVNAYGAKVRLTTNPLVVQDCKFLGEVKGSDPYGSGPALRGVGEENSEVSLRDNAGAMGANVVLLSRTRSNYWGSTSVGEAYFCPATPAVEATRSPAGKTDAPQPRAPTPAVATSSEKKISVVVTEAEVRGCTFIDSVNEQIVCPPEYSATTPCMAYRASKQGGNTVLAVGAGKVYNCPPR